MLVILSYLKFALSLFILFVSFFVLSLLYLYPYLWYQRLIEDRFTPASVFSFRFGGYFLLNNLAAPAISYLVSLMIIAVGSKMPGPASPESDFTQMLTVITFPMLTCFFASPFIACYYNIQLLKKNSSKRLELVLVAFLTITFYLMLYHLFSHLLTIKSGTLILQDTGWT